MADRRRETGGTDPDISRADLAAAMQESSRGMRDLQRYLNRIKDFDDAAFADATEGADRAETMELLASLNKLLGELDDTIEEVRTGERPAPKE